MKLLACLVAACGPAFAAIEPLALYTPLSDISGAASVDTYVQQMDILSKAQNFADATAAYEALFTNADPLLNAKSLAEMAASFPLASTAYAAYYRDAHFPDKFVRSALKGDGMFAGWDMASRRELLVKGVAYLGVHQHVLGLLDQSVKDCTTQHNASTTQTQRKWDVAWGLYAGSLEGPDGKGKGTMLHALAEKRCPQFGTCVGDGGAARANELARGAFERGRAAVGNGDCFAALLAKDAVQSQLAIPLIQGALREAYETDHGPNGGGDEGDGVVEIAEGWAFLSAVLPRLALCDPDSAAMIRSNMDVAALDELTLRYGATFNKRTMRDGFPAVKMRMESMYTCLGITCEAVGGMRTCTDDGSYCPGFEPCTTSGDGSAQNGKTTQLAASVGSTEGDATTTMTLSTVLVVLAVLGLLATAAVGLVVCKKKGAPAGRGGKDSHGGDRELLGQESTV